jgi:hypothetical protein
MLIRRIPWRVAEQMRKRYGLDAHIEAARRADELLDQGDVARFEIWRRVVERLNDLHRTRPNPGEALN